eukprot:Nk52_evm2s357 gene=Nk52_evmTU2s357
MMEELGGFSANAFPPRGLRKVRQGRQCGGAWTKIPRFVPNSQFRKTGVLQRMAVTQLGRLGAGMYEGAGGEKGVTGDTDEVSRLLDGFYLLEVTGIDEPEEIITVKICDCNLEQVVKEDLELFTNLDSINAGYNRLPIAPFGILKSLTQLDLGCNGIEVITIKEGDFPCLKELYLSSNHLTAASLVSLGTIPNLEKLDISGNQLSFLPLGMSFGATEEEIPFRKLKFLSLMNNRLTHATTFLALANIPQLEVIELGNNLIQAVPNVKHELSKNKKLKLMPTFCVLKRAFPNVKTLDLSSNSIHDSGAFVELTRWPSLQELIIFGNPVTKYSKGLPGPLMYHLVEERGVVVRKLEKYNMEKPSHSIPIENMYRVEDESPSANFQSQGLTLLQIQYGLGDSKALPPIRPGSGEEYQPEASDELFDEESTFFATQNVENEKQLQQDDFPPHDEKPAIIEEEESLPESPEVSGSAETTNGANSAGEDVNRVHNAESNAQSERNEMSKTPESVKAYSLDKTNPQGNIESHDKTNSPDNANMQDEGDFQTKSDSPDQTADLDKDRPDSIEQGITYIRNEIKNIKQKIAGPGPEETEKKTKKEKKRAFQEKEENNKAVSKEIAEKKSNKVKEVEQERQLELLEEYVYQKNYEMAFADIPRKYRGYEEFLTYDDDDVEYYPPQVTGGEEKEFSTGHDGKNAVSNRLLSTINNLPNPHNPSHPQDRKDDYNRKLLVKGPLIASGKGADIRMATRALRYALNNPLIFSSTFREKLNQSDIPLSMGTSFVPPTPSQLRNGMKSPTSYAFTKENFETKVVGKPVNVSRQDMQGNEILEFMRERNAVVERPLSITNAEQPKQRGSIKPILRPNQANRSHGRRLSKPPVERVMRRKKVSKDEQLWERMKNEFDHVKVEALTRDMNILNLTVEKQQQEDNDGEEI